MTNIVKKGAGRAAHAERTARHAQRDVKVGPTPTPSIIRDEVNKAKEAAVSAVKSTRKSATPTRKRAEAMADAVTARAASREAAPKPLLITLGTGKSIHAGAEVAGRGNPPAARCGARSKTVTVVNGTDLEPVGVTCKNCLALADFDTATSVAPQQKATKAAAKSVAPQEKQTPAQAKRANTPARRLAQESRAAMAEADASGSAKPAARKAAAIKPTPAKATKAKSAPATKAAEPMAYHPKVTALVQVAEGAGWLAEVESEGVYIVVTCTNEETSEALWVRFVDGKMDDTQMPRYTRPDGSVVLMRNVSAVKKQMVLAPSDRPVRSERKARAARVKSARSDEAPKRSLPFDIETITDAELADRIKGVAVTWRNGHGAEEVAIVSPRRSPQIKHHPKFPGVESKRIMSFFTVEMTKRGPVSGPERHVSLDRLMRIEFTK